MELRRVRFVSIEGLQRGDLEVAGEVWLLDVCAATWVTRDVMKLAAQFARYMAAPDAKMLTLPRIEQQIQLTRDEVKAALRLMKLYRVVEAFNIEGDGIRAALHLSALQRLRVLETWHRLDYLARLRAAGPVPKSERWLPPGRLCEDDAEAAGSLVLEDR